MEVDYNDERYTIEIRVCKNGNIISVRFKEPQDAVTFQEIIGVFEICKTDFVVQQMEANRRANAESKNPITPKP